LSVICTASGLEYYHTYSPRTHAILSIGRFINQLDDQFQTKIQKDLSTASTVAAAASVAAAVRHPKTDAKFLLYAGHDNTIGPLLNALSVRNAPLM